MSGEKRFRNAAGGYNKQDVNEYIERILGEFDNRLKAKDEEISSLKGQVREMKARYDSAVAESTSMMKDKERIANALIQAQDKADNLIEEARAAALAEKDRLETLLEAEKEKIIAIKRDVKNLRSQVSGMLNNYQEQLENLETVVDSREAQYTSISGGDGYGS